MSKSAHSPKPRPASKNAIPPPGIRCIFTDLAGRQCRKLALRPTGKGASRTTSGLCLAHATEERQLHDAEAVAEEIMGNAPGFKTAVGVNHILEKILELTVNDRIPMRKAAILTYQASLLLQSIGSVTKEFEFTFKDKFRSDLILEAVQRIAGNFDPDTDSDTESASDSASETQ